MRSMTGFCLGESPFEACKLAVEIRGVNHRFLDVRVRVPRELGDLAGFVEQVAREKLTRGRFEVAMRVDGLSLGAPVLDRERARAAFNSLCQLRDELAPGTEVPLTLLGAIPDLFVSSIDREIDRLREATRTAFDVAVVALDAMRAREGVSLRRTSSGAWRAFVGFRRRSRSAPRTFSRPTGNACARGPTGCVPQPRSA